MMLQFEVVDETTGIGDNVFNSDEIVVYPNPLTEGNSLLTITTDNEIDGYAIYDLTGWKLVENNIGVKNEQLQINLAGISTGTYLLKLFGKNFSHNAKIVIK